MLTCIPTKDNAGPEAEINDHFGSAEYYTLYDTESGEIKSVPNNHLEHKHGHCNPLKAIIENDIDCVVCPSLGRRAFEILQKRGIKLYTCDPGQVKDVVGNIKSGNLTEMDINSACRGHGHGEGHGQGFVNIEENQRGQGAQYGQFQGRGCKGHGGGGKCGNQ